MYGDNLWGCSHCCLCSLSLLLSIFHVCPHIGHHGHKTDLSHMNHTESHNDLIKDQNRAHLEGETYIICYPNCVPLWSWSVVSEWWNAIKSNDCHLHPSSPIMNRISCVKVRVWVQPIRRSCLYVKYSGVCCEIEPHCIIWCWTMNLRFEVRQ